MPTPRQPGSLARSLHAVRSILAFVALALGCSSLLPHTALAACDVIPGALSIFPSGVGETNTPFAAPDQLVQIRVRPQVCDGESPGLGGATPGTCLAAESLRATFVFFDQSLAAGAPRAVVLARDCGLASTPGSGAAAAANLPGVASAECRSVPASALSVVSVPVTGGNECRLNVRLPATPDPALGPDFTLAGPARILVDLDGAPLPPGLASTRCATLASGAPIACIDELYRLNGTCDTSPSAQSSIFSHFVALPRPNVYADMVSPDPGARPAARFALDDRGNLLANVDWSGVLFQGGASDAFPPPQLVNFFTEIGSGLPSAPGTALQVVEESAFNSYSPVGIQLPPLFEPSSDASQALTLFGSADAQTSVIRIERNAGRCEGTSVPCLTDAACGGGTCDTSVRYPAFDLRYCISANGCEPPSGSAGAPPVPASGPGGPGAILPANYTAEIDGFVPLENLNVCRNLADLTCLLRDETLPVRFADDGATPLYLDRNADGDTLDLALSLRDARSGAKLALPPLAAEGVAVTTIHEAVSPLGPFAFPVRARSSRVALASGPDAAGNGCVATLLAEPDEGASDGNQDGESYDPLLRVYCPDESGALVQKAIDPAGNVEKLAIVAKPAVLGPGRTLSPLQPGLEPLVISGGQVVFLLDEPGNAEQIGARVDVSDGGAPASAPSGAPAIGASGDLVCFESEAQNLVSTLDKHPFGTDVFCRDVASDETYRVNRTLWDLSSTGDTPLCQQTEFGGDGPASAPAVAGSGERARVCYESDGRLLVTGDFNGTRDVFLYDRCSCDTILLSRSPSGQPFATPSAGCALAESGEVAAFANDGRVYTQTLIGSAPESCGVGPVASDRLRIGGSHEVSAGVPGTASAPSLSSDGGVVAFQVDAGGVPSVYVSESGGAATCIDADGVPGCDEARAPHLSADGRLVTYQSTDAASGLPGVFVLDRVTGLAEAVGASNAASSEGNGEEAAVAFTSADGPDVVVRDRVTLLAKFADPDTGTTAAELSADGRTVVYAKGGGIYRTAPDPLDASADADGDGTATNAVLARLGLESGALQVLGPARQAAVAGSTVAFIDLDGAVFATSGDGLIGPFTLAGNPARARALAVSDAALCVLAESDGSLACAPAGSTALVAFGAIGEAFALEGDRVAVLSPPASPPPSPRSLRVLRTSDGVEIANVPGVRRFRMASNRYVAADQCEADLGVVLNGDGDTTDCLALVIAPDGTLFDTSDPARGTPRHTIVPCTGDVCDDTDPFKIFPYGDGGTLAKLRHLSVEAHEPLLFADLNGNGSTADVVVREFVAGASVAFSPSAVPPGTRGNLLAGAETGPGQSQAGASLPALVGYCDSDGDGEADTGQACQSDANCIEQGVCAATPCCVDIQPRVLALADSDGDGVFDVYDNCPTVFNPEQDPTDSDGDGTPDACDESRCGDGVVQPDEYCDYADMTLDPGTGRTWGSFCNGPEDPGPDCSPLVEIAVSEAAVNPGKRGTLPTVVFGSPVLNLGTVASGDRPEKMIEPGSFILEPLRADEPCGGPGAAPIDNMSNPTTYAGRLSDKNGDGHLDLALRFSVPTMRVAATDTQVCLRGNFRTVPGRFFEASFESRGPLNVK